MHVTLTYQFLKKIPWTKEFGQIPDIAHAHHEYLNGTGYPRGVPAEQIPLQSRIMTICDIFDALVSSDRPYKKSAPLLKALEILEDECKAGRLDPSLYRIFLEGKVYENPQFIELTGQPQKKAA